MDEKGHVLIVEGDISIAFPILLLLELFYGIFLHNLMP